MKHGSLGVITLSMLNIAAVLSIVNYPSQAEYGYAVIFFIGMSALLFFIPTALVSAEMASALPHNGGLYLWGKTAFGPGVGFLTVSMQWFNSLPWYGTVLTFIATTLAYMFDPELAENRFFVYAVILAVTWGCTIVNCYGVTLYARLSTVGVILGTMIPTLIIIVCAGLWLWRGNPAAIRFSPSGLFPSLHNINDWMLLAGMMVSLAGIDMTALHITDVKNPLKTYPLALLISSIVIIIGSAAGALAIALVVPPGQLSMASGAGEAFSKMFDALGMSYLTAPMCLMLCLGAITTVFTWLLGPSRGLLQVAAEGHLPKYWAQRNERNIPVHILILQAVIISLLSLVVFFMPTIGGAFWVFMALSAQMYMVMYLLMFTSAFFLRLRRPDLPRPYRIPGGIVGMFLVCFLGCLAALSAMLAGFIPPQSIRELGWMHCFWYSGLLGCGTLFFMSIPLYLLKRGAKTFGILLAVFLLSGCERRDPQPHAMPPMPVKVVQVREGEQKISYELIGTVKPQCSIRIVSRVSGFLLNRGFKEGEFVKSGTELYRIDPAPYELREAKAVAALKRSQAQLLNAKLEFERSETLYREKVAPPKRYDLAQADHSAALADVAAAEAELAQAQLNLSYCRIVAPFDGWIGLNHVDVGNYIAAPSSPLTELSAIDSVRVEFHLSDRYLSGALLDSVASGKLPNWPLKLKFQNGIFYEHSGTIRYWDNQLAGDTATLTMQGEFQNPGHRLLPGLFVYVILEDPVPRNVLMVNGECIQFDQGRAFCYVVERGDVLAFRPLSVGDRVGDDVVILSGLRKADRVVLAGNPLLRPGSRVQVLK